MEAHLPASETTAAVSQRITVSAETVAEVLHFYESGFCLQGYRAALKAGPLDRWTGTEAMIMAGRLSGHLGAPFSRRMFLRAYRHDRSHPHARLYFAYETMERRGPLATWNLIKSFGPMAEASAEIRADLLALQARAAGHLRDFEQAEALLKQALAAKEGMAWLEVERATLLEMEDRYEEALEAGRKALALHPHPFYRPGVQSVTHTLQLLDRDEEALALLEEATAKTESAAISSQLYVLQGELKLYGRCLETLERIRELSPLTDAKGLEWLTAGRARILHFNGDHAGAASEAAKLQDDFHKQFAARLATPAECARVQLPVHFVRQHYRTCAPATIAALGRFWKLPTDHLKLVEEICYDGTPPHLQRAWAEANGWAVREFRLTWECAVALIDRGVPFTVSTVETGNAHLQAIIGYDNARRTFIIRDPYQRYQSEAVAETFLKAYASCGPRCMVLVPSGNATLLAGLDLPEAELYDHVHAVDDALHRHDRAMAEKAVEALLAEAPEHALTWAARRRLAYYDGKTTRALECVEALLKLHPADANLRMEKLSCLRDGRREDRLAFLRECCEEKNLDPVFWQQQAQELSADAREAATALRLLRRSLRYRQVDATSFMIWADILWRQREFIAATELYRFAACLENKREGIVRSYFSAAQHLRQTEGALEFLRHRFERFIAGSHLPATSLFWALEEIRQAHQGFDFLKQALERRADDGDLRCFAAMAYARWGRHDEAAAMLAAAKGRVHAGYWRHTAASLADYQGQRAEALVHWRAMLDEDPLAMEAHRACVQMAAETEGREAAMRHLRDYCGRFPHHFALHQLYIEWLEEEPAAVREPVIRHLLAIDPANTWARRELANLLAGARRFDEALAEAEHARQLLPNEPYNYCTRGVIQEQSGNLAAARADYEQATRLSVDNQFAIRRLVLSATSGGERRAALDFIHQELVRQVVFGEGLLTYQDLAHPVLEPEELLGRLREALKARPDLWHAWSAVAAQLTSMGKLDEAQALLKEAIERFPLLPRLRADLARVAQARLDNEGEIQALEAVLKLSPDWGFAVRKLAEAQQRTARFADARATLERASARAPLDPCHHGMLADVLWLMGEREEAIARLKRALTLDPAYGWGWRTLREWSRVLNRSGLPLEMARELTVRRPGDGQAWLVLAENLDDAKDADERLSVLAKAIECHPRLVDAHDLRARALAEARRYDEAFAACRPAVWGESPPVELRLRTAWVLHRRGEREEALRALRQVLEENPDHVIGWRMLSEWCLEQDDFDGALKAAEKLVRLCPLDAVPLGYLADIKMRQNDRKGAKADLQRALTIEPAYMFAGFNLFDLQLEDRELVDAGKTLGILRQHLRSPWVTMREVQYAAARREIRPATEFLQALLREDNSEPDSLGGACEAFAKAGWEREVEDRLKQALLAPACNPIAGVHWVFRRINRNKFWCLGFLNRLPAQSEARRRALIYFAEALGRRLENVQAGDDIGAKLETRFLFWRLIRRHGDMLRQDPRGLGNVSYALTEMKRHKAVIRWMAGWETRNDLHPWMLENLATALRHRGEYAEATRVCRHALERCDADHYTPEIRVQLALEEALAGDAMAAQKHLSGVNMEKMTPHIRHLHAIVRAVLNVQNVAPAHRMDIYRDSKAMLLEAFADQPPVPAYVLTRRSLRRAMKRLAADCGNRRPVLWAHWMLDRDLILTLPLVAFFLGIILARKWELAPLAIFLLCSTLIAAKLTMRR